VSEGVTAEIEIDAPIETVYEAMMDPRRLGDWVTIHRELGELPELPLRKGSEFEQKLALAGKSFKVTWEVTRAEPPHEAQWEGSGPAGSGARVAYKLAQRGEGTQVRYENEFDFPAGFLGKAAGRLLVRAPAGKEAKRSLERLRSLLEDG
jgi:uncharacterized protein YndB with AHSA1/START domain